MTGATAPNAGSMLERVTSASLRESTSRDWDGWLEVLDAAGATDLDHKAIVAHLEREHPEVGSGWWRQTIAVGYEQARGKRVVGETAGAGFQIGVRRTIALTAAAAWELLTSRPELWLGDGVDIAFEPGERYDAPAGVGATAVEGEVRVVKPLDRVRMTWQPRDWSAPATLQLTFLESSPGKTQITAHMEKLPDAAARESMRTHWRAVLDGIAAGTR